MPSLVETGLAGALFTPVQQRVLGLLFGQPERRFGSSELIRLADSGTGAVHRQLVRLEHSGLVTASLQGNQKYYQANQRSPIFSELHGLIVKTVGIAEPLRDVFEALQGAEKILGRPINPTIWTVAEWERERSAEDSFGARVLRRPKTLVIGEESAAV